MADIYPIYMFHHRGGVQVQVDTPEDHVEKLKQGYTAQPQERTKTNDELKGAHWAVPGRPADAARDGAFALSDEEYAEELPDASDKEVEEGKYVDSPKDGKKKKKSNPRPGAAVVEEVPEGYDQPAHYNDPIQGEDKPELFEPSPVAPETGV